MKKLLIVSLFLFSFFIVIPVIAQEIEDDSSDDLLLEDENNDLIFDSDTNANDNSNVNDNSIIGGSEDTGVKESTTQEQPIESTVTESAQSEPVAVKMDKKQLKSNKKSFLKGLKKELKGYKKLTPEEIVAIQEDLENNKNAVSRLESDLSSCRGKMASLQSEINTLKAQLQSAQREIEELKANPPAIIADNTVLGAEKGVAANSSQNSNTKTSKAGTTAAGIVFKVQLGAYQQFDLNKTSIGDQKIEVDNLSGWKKYTAGSFKTYQEAADFKTNVNQMGITDAFIVAYKNGARIDIKTAVSELRQ